MREERAITLDTTAKQISPERLGVGAVGHGGRIRVLGANVPTAVDDALAVVPANRLDELGKWAAELIASRRGTVAARETEHRLRPATRVRSGAAQHRLRIQHCFERRRFGGRQAGPGRNATWIARARKQERTCHHRHEQPKRLLRVHPNSIDIRFHLRNTEALTLSAATGD